MIFILLTFQQIYASINRMYKFEHNPTFTPVFTALGAAAGGGGESCSLHVSILHSSPPLSAQLPPSSHLQSLTPLTSRYLGQLFSICKTCLFFADTMCKPSVPPRKDPTTNFVTVLSHLHSACIAFEELMYSGNSRYVIVVWSVVSKYL